LSTNCSRWVLKLFLATAFFEDVKISSGLFMVPNTALDRSSVVAAPFLLLGLPIQFLKTTLDSMLLVGDCYVLIGASRYFSTNLLFAERFLICLIMCSKFV
jgi:hypothetical protein